MRTLSRYGSQRMMVRYGTVVAGAVLLGLLTTFGAMLRSGTLHISQLDFMSYYASFRLVLDGHGSQIYDFHALSKAEAAVTYPLKLKRGVLPYIYPPYFSLALAPLAAIPYLASYLVSWGLNLALLALTLLAFHCYLPLSRPERILLSIATLSFLPVFVALLQGQVSILLLAALTASFFAARSGRDATAGALLALALIKPTYVVPFLAVLMLRRRWRSVAAFALTGLLLAAVPLPVLGPSVNQAYVHTLIAASRWQGGHGASVFAFFTAKENHTFAGMAQLLLAPTTASLATYLLDLLALLALLRATGRSQSLDLPLGLAVVVGLLISPHVFIHDLSLLLLPAAIAVRYRTCGVGRIGLVLAGIYLSLLLGFGLVSIVPIQLSVIAMTGLGLWFVAAVQGEGVACAVPDPAKATPRESPVSSTQITGEGWTPS